MDQFEQYSEEELRARKVDESCVPGYSELLVKAAAGVAAELREKRNEEGLRATIANLSQQLVQLTRDSGMMQDKINLLYQEISALKERTAPLANLKTQVSYTTFQKPQPQEGPAKKSDEVLGQKECTGFNFNVFLRYVLNSLHISLEADQMKARKEAEESGAAFYITLKGVTAGEVFETFPDGVAERLGIRIDFSTLMANVARST